MPYTSTATKVVTSTKLAIATAFLGLSAVAAAATGTVGSDCNLPPDLVVNGFPVAPVEVCIGQKIVHKTGLNNAESIYTVSGATPARLLLKSSSFTPNDLSLPLNVKVVVSNSSVSSVNTFAFKYLGYVNNSTVKVKLNFSGYNVCMDTDPNNLPEIFGTTTLGFVSNGLPSSTNGVTFGGGSGGSTTLPDSCSGTGMLNQFSCVGAIQAASSTFDCASIGKSCVNGMCVLNNSSVVISAVSDSTTVSSIRLPSINPQQFGKWNVAVTGGPVNLNRITFSVLKASLLSDTNSSNFGTLYLYDANNPNIALAATTYIPGGENGYVRFQGFSLPVSADAPKMLVVKATVNGSGVMAPASVNSLAVRKIVEADIELISQAGQVVPLSNIKDLSGSAALGNMAVSTFYLFHNSAPIIQSVAMGTNLEISSQAPIFKFTVTNPGDRELYIGTTTVNIAAIGLSTSTTTGGTVKNFQLWETTAGGGLGNQLAAANPSYCIGSAPCTSNSLSVYFGSTNSINNSFNSFAIAPGSSRSFVVVADTTAILNGKTSGSVSVAANLDGATGFVSGDQIQEKNWANGVLNYHYVPINGLYNGVPYSASDSYDVVGPTLTKSL